MKQGEIYWVDFPGGAGRAQAGRRPAVILQSPRVNSQLPTFLAIPLTTQQDALRFPGTTLITPDSQNGLRHPSVALVFQITAIDKKFLGSIVGQVSDSAMSDIWAALGDITDRTIT